MLPFSKCSRRRQRVLSKWWYQSTTLRSVKTQIMTCIFTALKISNLKYRKGLLYTFLGQRESIDLKELRKYMDLMHKEGQCEGKRQQITFIISFRIILSHKAVSGQVLKT
jgi:hypothetical protein